MKQVGIGVIGCGNISDVYLKNLTQVFRETKVVALTDIDRPRAQEQARRYGVEVVCDSAEALLHRSDVEIALILTQPSSHFSLARQSILAGKHTYSEKPLSYTREEAAELLRLAKEHGVRLGSAPDTILGAVAQTGRKLIADGWIGDIVGASICASWTPPETWHPNPDFLYKKGAGPLYDNGPYLLATLASVLGPMREVSCMARKTFARRLITSEPKFGSWIDVEVPTFLKGVISFESGAIASIMLSTDSRNAKAQEAGFEVYGTLGTVVMSHPCMFNGTVSYKRNGSEEWTNIPLLFDYTDDSRGIGVADLAHAILSGGAHRLNEPFVAHVVDGLISMDESWQTGERIAIRSTCDRPALLDMGLIRGEVCADSLE